MTVVNIGNNTTGSPSMDFTGSTNALLDASSPTNNANNVGGSFKMVAAPASIEHTIQKVTGLTNILGIVIARITTSAAGEGLPVFLNCNVTP